MLWDFYLEGETVSAKLVKGFCDSVVTRSGALTGVSDDGRTVGIDPITIITLLTTILPQVFAWVKQCRGLKNEEVQPQIAAQHADQRSHARQQEKLVGRLKMICRKGQVEEKKRAKATGIPADIGRFSCDDATLNKLASQSIGEFCNMRATDANAMVAYCTSPEG